MSISSPELQNIQKTDEILSFDEYRELYKNAPKHIIASMAEDPINTNNTALLDALYSLKSHATSNIVGETREDINGLLS